MVLVFLHCQQILSVKTTLYIIPSLLWLVLTHVEFGNCPVLGTITAGLLPLCSVVYPIISMSMVKFPIIMQSPLPTSLIALCHFSLFCLVMLGQRYTTPMVTVVCPETSLHHMASL